MSGTRMGLPALAGLALLAAAGAAAQEPTIDLHIIGFGVSDSVRAQLEAAAAAGGGRYYQSDDEIQLTAALGQATGLAPAAAVDPASREAVMVVLDVSNSMWGQVEGRAKIEIAREAIAELLAGWSPDADLGLVAYGHRREGDCTDIETLLPAGPADPAAFAGIVGGLTPTGRTPLSAAVRQAAEQLRYQDRPATVILFSDGIETCNADPCALAEELERGGVRFTVHVVGFDVAAEEAGLACLAQATGGLYLAAENAPQLSQALRTVGDVAANPALADLTTLEAVDAATGAVLAQGVVWTVVSLDSEERVPISAGVARPALPLAPGAYTAEARIGPAVGRVQIDVVAGQAGTVRVVLAAPAAKPPPPVAAAGCGEPNDSFGTAPLVVLPTEIGGAIDPARDGDFCALAVPGPGVLAAGALQAPDPLELIFRVYDADRAVVRDWTTELLPGQPAATADLPEAGAYVLEIRDSYDDAAAPDPYGLALEFTPAIDATEPNDSFGRAAPLPLDTPVEMSVFPQREHDFLEIQADRQGELTVTATGVPAAVDVALRLYDADYAVLRDWVAPSQPGQDTTLTADLPAAGRYVLEVADSYDDARDPAPFTLTARLVPSADAFEPNNRISLAAPLAFDSPVQAAILPQRDADFFWVEAPNRGALRVVAGSVPGTIDVAIRLYDANLAVLRDWVAPSAPGQDTILTADLPAPGRYVLEVRDSYDDARDAKPFTLTASFTAAEDAAEPNDRLGRATPLALGVPVAASILPVRDPDFFVLDAPAAGPLTVRATQVPAALDVALRLYDRELAVLRDWVAPSQPGQDTILTVELPAPGRYYLEVRDSYDDASAPEPFTLTASQP